jgi:Zn-dependent protease
MLGHLTWDPRVHMGWLSLILVATVGIGFGRTPTNPRYFRDGRKGDALVSVAGPAVNLVLGIVLALCASTLDGPGRPATVKVLFWMFRLASSFNFALFILNLIPIPPLDGFHILRALTEPNNAVVRGLEKAQGVMFIVVLLVIWNIDLFRLTDVMTESIIGLVAGLLG